MTPARVQFQEEEGGEGVNWRRELNLKEAQVAALERELASLKAWSRTSRASTIFQEDYHSLQPKHE